MASTKESPKTTIEEPLQPTTEEAPQSTTEETPQTTAEENPQSSTHDGNCHCGAVRFTVTLTPPLLEQNVSSCDCSICTRNGYLLVYPLDKDVTWHQGYAGLTEYKFANEKIAHKFCQKCGTSICAKSTNPDFFYDHTAINVRTLKDVNVNSLNLKKFAGSAMKPDYAI